MSGSTSNVNSGVWISLGDNTDTDVGQLFQAGASWQDVESKLTGFKIFADTFSLLSVQQMIQLEQNIQSIGASLILETGVLPETGTGGIGYGIEGFDGSFINEIEQLAWDQWYAANYLNVTLQPLAYVAMDEPLYYGSLYNGSYSGNGLTGYAPLWSIATTAAKVAAELKAAQVYNPTLQFGDIEPIPAVTASQVSQWVIDYKADTGSNFAFFQADVMWNVSGWQTTLEQVSAVLQANGIPLDIILDGDDTGTGTTQWTNQALTNLISIYLDPKIDYSSLDVENWEADGPTEALGSTGSDETTGTLAIVDRYAVLLPQINAVFEAVYGRSGTAAELYQAAGMVGNGSWTLAQLTSTLTALASQNATLVGTGTTGTESLVMAATTSAASNSTSSSAALTLIADTTSATINLASLSNPSLAGTIAVYGSTASARTLLLPNGFNGTIDVLALNGATAPGITIDGGTASDNVILGSGHDIFVVGSIAETIVDDTGTGDSTIEASAATATATIIGGSSTQARLLLSNTGTIYLSNSDANVTVVLANGTNHLVTDWGTGIVVDGSTGNDTIDLYSNSDTVNAGSGTTLINAFFWLASGLINGYSESKTTLAITSAGQFALNAGDNNLTVDLYTGGPNYVTVGNGANIALVVGAATDWVTAGSGNDLIETNVANAGAFLFGNSIAQTQVLITNAGTAFLNNSDSNFTLSLGGRSDTVNLGFAANIKVVANSGTDSVTIGALTQSFVAGAGVDVINAQAYLAGAAVTGYSEAKTMLAITNAGTVTLNAADSNLTVILYAGGPDYTTLGNGANLAVVVGNSGDWVTAGSGNDIIDASTTNATAVFHGYSQSATTLVLTSAGSVQLNSGDSNLTVDLAAGSNNLGLSQMGFVTAVGAASGTETITAGAANQTLISQGATDTLIGYKGYGDVFSGTYSALSHDTIQNFGGSDLIDITNLSRTGATVSYNSASGLLTVSNNGHSAAIHVGTGYSIAQFSLSADAGSGTYIHWV